MRRFKLFLSACMLALAFGVVAVPAQTQEFTNEGVEYALELPSPTWKAVARPDGVHQHMEFINGDRLDGFLRVRKEVVDQGSTPSDLANRDQDVKLRFLDGFVLGKQESFAGRLSGITSSYEFIKTGKPMAGRIYYLQADNRTVYTLHFTGQRDKLSRIRNQTDSMARTFRLK